MHAEHSAHAVKHDDRHASMLGNKDMHADRKGSYTSAVRSSWKSANGLSFGPVRGLGELDEALSWCTMLAIANKGGGKSKEYGETLMLLTTDIEQALVLEAARCVHHSRFRT